MIVFRSDFFFDLLKFHFDCVTDVDLKIIFFNHVISLGAIMVIARQCIMKSLIC